MCFTLASGCSGVSWTSTSFIARRRRKLVRDLFEKEGRFICSCPSKGNYAYDIAGLCVGDRHRNVFQQAERYESLLVVPEAGIFKRESGARKHLFGIDKVNAVFLEVLEPLRFVPLEPHLQSVYTATPERNQCFRQPANARSERRRAEQSESKHRLPAVRSSAKLDTPALTSSKPPPLPGTTTTLHLRAHRKEPTEAADQHAPAAVAAQLR